MQSDSAATRLHASLVDMIADGHLAPGDLLSEAALSERFQVSRTPVREAIQRLQTDGLADRGPRRTHIVRRLDAGELADAFEGLAEIEALATGLAAQRMSALDRRRLEAIVEEADASVRAASADSYAAENAAFHDILLAGAGNRTIARMAGMARRRLVAYRNEQFVRSDRMESSHREHLAILEAVRARDATAAATAMRQHILTSALNVRDMVDGTPERPK
ncbi:MAG: GntR family transcriptional regulator [Pseudomonadota bacterium]